MYESNIDAVEEYVDTLVDSYNDYIDSVKEALDAERELFDFKKNVQKQAKDIAEIERRIASLSGSENAADIAERRKLEAQLYESRESLNDTYYDHAKESQQNALDEEAKVYEETMTLMVEGMRTGLEEATVNMQTFLDKVTIAVSMNAEDVLAKYRETELPLDDALTNPWEKAKAAVGSYGDNAKNLMDVWKANGYFAEFNSTASTNLQSPWNAGVTAANEFKTGVNIVMKDVTDKIATNVKTASSELSRLYQQIIDTEKQAADVDFTPDGNGGGGNGGFVQKKYYTTATLNVGGHIFTTTKSATTESAAKSAAQIELAGQFADFNERRGISEAQYENSWLRTYKNKIKYDTSYYAKGTTGTKRDGWAITDESWIGEEITLAAGKNGQLQYLKKGSAVMPADISANLVEWGKLNPDMLNVGATPNINLINNAVNKPEFNFTFDALVKADNITKETLPAVKELVAQELNRFTKELNYAIKGKGGR